MAFSTSIFAAVPLGTRDRVRPSPRLPASFQGIRIRTPGTVPLRAGRVPLCGAFLLPTTDIPAEQEVIDSMWIHARRVEDDELLSTQIGPPAEAMPIEVIANPVDPDPDVSVGGYFNVDLRPLLGPVPGQYVVWVQQGPHRSNERTLTLVGGP